MTAYIVEADGGSRGNPGPAGYGAVVRDAADGTVLAEVAEAIGSATNNVAEYRGLIAGLTAVLALGGDGAAVEVRMDSKLVIEQMAGRWKIKHEGLRPLASQAAALARRLGVTWRWIPRERNAHADRLANEAMDAAAKGLPSPHPLTTRPTDPPKRSSSSGTPPAEQPPLFSVSDRPAQDTVSDRPAQDTASPGTGWRPPSATGTILMLLRHGETPLSVERRFSGLGDAELTSNGRAQAQAAALRLARGPHPIDVIVSSPLKRARATAEAVAERLGLAVLVEDGLREVDFGAWEGHTFTEIQRRWPDELAAWLADPKVAPPGGEDFAAVARRVEDTRQRVLGDHAGKAILAVSHVTPIKMLLSSALTAPLAAVYRMHLDLACLSRIDYYPDGPAVVRAFNDTAHLR